MVLYIKQLQSHFTLYKALTARIQLSPFLLLFNNAVNIWDYTALVIGRLMNMEQLVKWQLAGEIEVLGENLASAILSTTNPIWLEIIHEKYKNNHQNAFIFSLRYWHKISVTLSTKSLILFLHLFQVSQDNFISSIKNENT
jgi:hypothetical protein